MNMIKAHYPETVKQILGTANLSSDGLPMGQSRTPLHVDYGSLPGGFARAQETHQVNDEEIFNAIGSRVWTNPEVHLPVLDLDHGATVQAIKLGSKAVVFASSKGKYDPSSLLRDVLGDNGIDAEVFRSPTMEHSNFMQRTYFRGMAVTSLALRSKDTDVFVAVDSTQERHSHLYIQQAFSDEDHKTLIDELEELGVITPTWRSIVEQEGMGVVRTPWTKREDVYKLT